MLLKEKHLRKSKNTISYVNRYPIFNYVSESCRGFISGFAGILSIQQKKTISENKSSRYTLLNTEVFIPLKKNIIEENTVVYSNLHNFTFDISGVRNTPYFSEGVNHLNQDISPEFENNFKNLEKEVNDYNDSLEKFERKEIFDLILEHFSRYGFHVNGDVQIPPLNTVSIIPESMALLKRYWCENISFNIMYGNNQLSINNIIIATVSEDNEIEIKKRLDELKDLDEIQQKYKNLKESYSKIKQKGKAISDVIEFNVISMINKGEYATTCDECSNFIHNS